MDVDLARRIERPVRYREIRNAQLRRVSSQSIMAPTATPIV
jgi:hypothetical protein